MVLNLLIMINGNNSALPITSSGIYRGDDDDDEPLMAGRVVSCHVCAGIRAI